jgi:hypothetical protein
MTRLLAQLRTSKQLGWRNIAAVTAHRAALRAGVYKRLLPISPCPVPEHLAGSVHPLSMPREHWLGAGREACLAEADAVLGGTATWFSHELHPVGSPPDWFLDPVSGQRFRDGSEHWSRCRPFAGADIKRCWELSRWAWATLLARAWRWSGDSRYSNGLNIWIQSWCQANPVNAGSNWLCGQEASMRLLHAMQAWQLCDIPGQGPSPTPLRAAFVAAHLQRIAATERYAQAQDNNHWTSEAAALFIGGSWLGKSTSSHAAAGQRWARIGRRALECSVRRLVLADGSFAQHSLTYHRLLLDTLAQVELWRRWLDLPPFSERFQQRSRAATDWLAVLLDPLSGDGPNLGSNDGAFCYQLHNQPYRDFRPTLQLAALLFHGKPTLASGPWDEPLVWLALFPPAEEAESSSPPPTPSAGITLFPQGGYAVLRTNPSTWALLRLPTHHFRPAHADPLHLDLWHRGVNLLRDGGSYAYNASPADLTYFPGIASHNSVQFDGAQPMPRLGRFLWGDWLQLEAPPNQQQSLDALALSAAYRGPHGRHQRRVEVDPTGLHWRITDQLSGFCHQALLRWRLCPADWHLEAQELVAPIARLHFSCDQPIRRIQLLQGWESRFYGKKTELPVLELEPVQAPAKIITLIDFSV